MASGTLRRMDAERIGRSIQDARKLRGYSSTQKLAAALGELMKAKRKEGEQPKGKGKDSLSRPAVDNWENGGGIPPWDKVELLAELFGDPYDEEWILFGQRREEQLAAEKPILALLSPQELELLQEYRHANDSGRKSILTSAKAFRRENPLPLASVQALRGKDA